MSEILKSISDEDLKDISRLCELQDKINLISSCYDFRFDNSLICTKDKVDVEIESRREQ